MRRSGNLCEPSNGASILVVILAILLLTGCGDNSNPEDGRSGGADVSVESGSGSPALQDATTGGAGRTIPDARSEPEQTMRLLIQSFRQLISVMRTVVDEPTATASVPELTRAITEVRRLVGLADAYSPEARAEVHPRFADMLTAETKTFDRELGRILQTPGAAPPLYELFELMIPVRR